MTPLSSRKTSHHAMSSSLIPCLVNDLCPCILNTALIMSLSATGGSAMKAVDVLIEHGVTEERIIFINLVRTLDGCWVINSSPRFASRLHLPKV